MELGEYSKLEAIILLLLARYYGLLFAIPLLHDQRKIQEPYYNKSHIVHETITNTKRVLLKKERVNAEKKYCSGHTTRIYAVQ